MVALTSGPTQYTPVMYRDCAIKTHCMIVELQVLMYSSTMPYRVPYNYWLLNLLDEKSGTLELRTSQLQTDRLFTVGSIYRATIIIKMLPPLFLKFVHIHTYLS